MPTSPKTFKRKAPTPRLAPSTTRYGQGRGGRPWRRLRERILERDGWLCQCEDCQQRKMPLPAHEVDHIIPLSQGGTDDPSNLRAISRSCHRAKSAREARHG